MPESPDQARYVTVARLVRVHGNRGELAAELEIDDAGLLQALPDVYLWDGLSHRQRTHIESAWPHKNRLILKFDGIDSISDAEPLAGWELQIPAGSRPAAPAGRVYVSDLVGCRVVEASSGRTLGEVRGLLETGAAPLLEVAGEGREILVPLATSICVEIDTAGRVIRVDLPEGLEELNPGSL